MLKLVETTDPDRTPSLNEEAWLTASPLDARKIAQGLPFDTRFTL